MFASAKSKSFKGQAVVDTTSHPNMSLSIPNAPNAGLFKAGYQK